MVNSSHGLLSEAESPPTAVSRFGAHGMAVLWVSAGIIVANHLAAFDPYILPAGPSVLGLPLGAWVERTLLWGVGPIVARRHLHPGLMTIVVITLGMVSSYAAAPRIGDALGREAIGIAIAFLPAQLFLHWTTTRRCLAGRATLHFILTASLLIGIVPALILELGGSGVGNLNAWAPWPRRLLAETLLIPFVLAVAAVIEFATHGQGTPMPSDPPQRLVQSGPYAYVANPMQIAKVVAPILVGVIIARPIVCAVGLFMLAWGTLVTYRHEDQELARRFGLRWHRYRRHVPRWWPRWHPWRDPELSPARLYVDAACPTCTRLGRWFTGIAGLEVHSAALHPPPVPGRISYDPQDGSPEIQGVRAVARALEHRNFGWALWGWSARLPGVRWLADTALDMVLGGPRQPLAAASTHPPPGRSGPDPTSVSNSPTTSNSFPCNRCACTALDDDHMPADGQLIRSSLHQILSIRLS